ncbi:MAG TPA: hypothetical protein VEX68_28520 [Bryobacteraceae bacterium]|nr:hypothetical protein [Bryobacteraceae bacterium]
MPALQSLQGPNIAGIDPHIGEVIRLFNPRKDVWADHFFWMGAELSARTAVGQVTIQVLFINDPEVMLLRQTLLEEGRFPRTA